MGAVLLAHDPDCGRTLAVKVLLATHTDPTLASRFLDEARLTARLQHPGIPPVHEIGALVSLRRGHELGSKSPGLRLSSARMIRECEALLDLDRKLTAVRSGEAQPADAAERVALGMMCLKYKRVFRSAAGFYADAFAAEPKLAADLQRQHRYNAACCAVLAAAGQGEDAGVLPDKVIGALRLRALRWLRSDLAVYAQLAEGDARRKEAVRRRLAHWKEDADLASVRDQAALARLPDLERADWQRLWAEGDTVLRKTQP